MKTLIFYVFFTLCMSQTAMAFFKYTEDYCSYGATCAESLVRFSKHVSSESFKKLAIAVSRQVVACDKNNNRTSPKTGNLDFKIYTHYLEFQREQMSSSSVSPDYFRACPTLKNFDGGGI